ncbi:MAG: hypothetical protein IJR50_09690 [Treponema sp.]|nr:hypothetical protein [Treponema sp.]
MGTYSVFKYSARVYSVLAAFLIILQFGFSQTSSPNTEDSESSALQMPSMPSMPAISAPSFGTPFYTPGKPQPPVTSRSTDKMQSEPQNETNTEQRQMQTPTMTSKKNFSNTTPSFVTASDLTSLANAGILNNFHSLFNDAATPLMYGQHAQQNQNTELLLGQILSELAELKRQNSAVVANAQISDAPVSRTSASQPAILRFIANGYDVLASCRTIYFSDIEADGSFLLTGDRKYISSGQTRNETFYLLFKMVGSSGFSTQYTVEPAIVQDYENTFSFVYQLAQHKDLTATKTGNLVTMRVVEPEYNMDLLIDIGAAQ